MPAERKYTERFIEGNGARLQYLAWGGTGQVLILISGLGDTPFLFDSLATELSLRFHVIGYSRRFHGKSTAHSGKLDNATLVSDLLLLMDSLRLEKANLLGWSLGGNEITEFAACYPERIDKLIYFESGYDLSDGGFASLTANVPKHYLPDSAVMTSLEPYREWYHHFWFGDVKWNDALEANLLASSSTRSDGSIETIPVDALFTSFLEDAMKYRRRYKDVHSPALAIYAEPFFYPADTNAATIALYDSLENNIVKPWRAANKKRIQEELENVTIIQAPAGTHASFLFRSHEFLVKSISNFLEPK